MKFHQPLDDLLSQKPRVKILRYLSLNRLEMNGRRIASDLALNPQTCLMALRELVDQGVLVMRNVGNTHLFRLNEQNYVVEQLLRPLFAAESGLLQTAVQEIVAGLTNSVVSIILYGSASRREERPFSDLDLLVLVASQDERQKVQDLFEQKNESFVARFGNVLSPLVLSVTEFRQRYKDGDPLIQEIVNTGRVIHGQLISEVMVHGTQEDSQ